MGFRHSSEQTPLYVRAKNAILMFIRQNQLSENKLPSEETLCDMLGVSRPTVREALMALCREGIVSKKHGTGNLVHRSTLTAQMRFDKFSDFTNLLEENGYRVKVHGAPFRVPTDEEKAILTLAGGSESATLFQENLYYADDMPAILAYNFTFFPQHNLDTDAIKKLLGGPFATMIASCTGEELAHAIIQLKPDIAKGPVAETFSLAQDMPILKWKESHYSIHDTLVAESVIYFNPQLPELTTLRKW